MALNESRANEFLQRHRTNILNDSPKQVTRLVLDWTVKTSKSPKVVLNLTVNAVDARSRNVEENVMEAMRLRQVNVIVKLVRIRTKPSLLPTEQKQKLVPTQPAWILLLAVIQLSLILRPTQRSLKRRM